MPKRSISVVGSVAVDPSARRRRTPRRAVELGITGDQWAAINPVNVKKELKQHARELAKQVKDDWHDGYEDQSLTCAEWLVDVSKYLQAVMDIGVGQGKALKECHQGLMFIGDSYRDLAANPIRVDLDENFGDWNSAPEGCLKLPWRSPSDVETRICYGGNVLKDLCGVV